MTLSPEVQDGVKTYLWNIAASLQRHIPTSRSEILRDLDSHIHEALKEMERPPTMEDLRAILATMPTPESYAGEDPSRATADKLEDLMSKCTSNLQRLVWQSVVGPLLLVLALPLLALGLTAFHFGQTQIGIMEGVFQESTSLQDTFEAIPCMAQIGGCLLIFISGIVLFASRKIGKAGIDRIRESGSALYGFVGSFTAYIVPELILISSIIAILFIVMLCFVVYPNAELAIVAFCAISAGVCSLRIRSRWIHTKKYLQNPST